MTPRHRLHGAKPQVREFSRHRIHADLRIDQHVERFGQDRLGPLLRSHQSVNEARSVGLRDLGFAVDRLAEMKDIELDALWIELRAPALDDRVPHRVVANMRGHDPEARSLASLALAWNQSLL